MSTAFSSLPLLPAALVEAVAQLGYAEMTAIQAAALPELLAGKDVIAQAKTGSGKTAAFGLALLAKINPRYFGCQALILCPTRELADQVAQEIRRLARTTDNLKVLTLCGGMPFGPQIASLEHGAHIVVGTPGRIQEHLRKDTLRLNGLNTFVLDEADRMLDMGFIESIQTIAESLPKRRQTVMFSATYPDSIAELASQFMASPVRIEVETLHSSSHIEQRFYRIHPDERFEAVLKLLMHHRPTSCVAFCQTRQQADELAEFLGDQRLSALPLHGDMEQRDRDQALIQFAQQSISVLVATHVAARGLDISGLDMVTNVELSRDPYVHVHRIGRSCRAGEQGLALSLATDSEQHRAQAIEDKFGEALEWKSLPNARSIPYDPPMQSLVIAAGRKDKLRPGDILGALTGDAGLTADQVGKITLTDHTAYVAIQREHAQTALEHLQFGKIKGRNHKVRLLR